MKQPIHIRIFYPADPAGIVAGGVDTFIKGLIKYAPSDLIFSLVGMTTDELKRPVGAWTRCILGANNFDFYPVVKALGSGKSRLPLSVRFTSALIKKFSILNRGFDIYDFHRIEPALIFLSNGRAKNAYFHQDMAVLRLDKADIGWRFMPGLYFAFEKLVANGLSSAWCVRQQGVDGLRARYPKLGARINFVPTWVDSDIFYPASKEQRSSLRSRFSSMFGLAEGCRWILTVGRLDKQKDPILLLQAFAALIVDQATAQLIFIGDGIMRPEVEACAEQLGLRSKVFFVGLQSQEVISELLKAGDLFALSSAYEGMPMALLEALGSGLPVVTTDVGEVRRVVHSGLNGMVVTERSAQAFADGIRAVLNNLEAYGGQSALDSVRDFSPSNVLQQIFQNYRDILK